MARNHYLSLSALALSALLCGCSGGSDPAAPPTVDMTGHWMLYLTPTGGVETGPSATYIAQNGASINGPAMTGSVSANNVSIVSDPGIFVITFNGTANATQATGSMTISGIINATGTFRLERFTPAGTMDMTGSIQGVPINVINATTVAGSRDYLDQALTQLDCVEFALNDENVQIEVAIDVTGLVVGALNVPGDVTISVLYRDDVNTIEEAVTSGTLTVNTYDGTSFEGTFSFTMTGGNTLTGAFDVTWDIDSYDP